MKTCSDCLKSLSVDYFNKRTKSIDGLCSICKLCNKKRVGIWRKQNPDKVKNAKNREKSAKAQKQWRTKNYEQHRNSYLIRKFGITLEQYNTKLQNQNFKCAICNRHQDDNFNKEFSVDHNHNTGQIRGLLCQNCNPSLGGFKDSIELLLNAIDYLKTFENKT